MTDVVLHQPQSQTTLAISEDQQTFTDPQRQALAHIGVENASDADLGVFFHVVKRTGLDPFARQIYMIGRWTKDGTKQTIQTGIDGYRLIGHRAAARARETVRVDAPEWAHEDGSWRPVWRFAWGEPIGARITVHRAGQPFTAVALFDEYKQTKRDGGLTQMWAQRPAGQIAKCAEALAWRLAFPQDLSGLYVEEELEHAPREPATPRAPRVTAETFLSAEPVEVHDAQEEPAPVADTSPEKITAAQMKMLQAMASRILGPDRDNRLAWLTRTVGRNVESANDLSKAEARQVIDALDELEQQQAQEPPA